MVERVEGEKRKEHCSFRTLNISAFHFLGSLQELPLFSGLWSVSDSLAFHWNKTHGMPGLRLWTCGEEKPTWDAYGHIFVGALTLWCLLPWAHVLWKVIPISLNSSDKKELWDMHWRPNNHVLILNLEFCCVLCWQYCGSLIYSISVFVSVYALFPKRKRITWAA